MASANQTTATGSLKRPVMRRGLPAPSSIASQSIPDGPSGRRGGPVTAPVTTGRRAGYNTRYRTLPVGEIQSQLQNPVSAWYGATGQPVPRGTVLNVEGHNTSGVGPGTRGYRGQGSIQGYSFENQGTAQTKGRSNYAPYFGGLNEFYQNQQTAGQWDQLQGRAAMDRNDAIGSRMGQMSQFAAGRGDYETADAFAAALADRAAQRMAAQQGGPWSGLTTYGNPGGAAPAVLPGSQAEINAFQPAGFLPQPQTPVTPDLDPNSWEVQAALDAAAERGRRPLQPGESATRGPVGARSSFTNAQGSFGPGGTQTSYGGTQSGGDFFQQSADRQGVGNAFAQPGPGYGGVADSSQNIDEYGRLMAVRNKLRK